MKKNLTKLTEEKIAEIIACSEKEMDREESLQVMKIVDLAFKLRIIPARNRNLKADLAFFGHKIFPLEQKK